MQKTLFSFLSLSFSLFLSCCIAEENGAYASVGFEYSISHAIQHNNPFLNQEAHPNHLLTLKIKSLSSIKSKMKS
ncbi:hypothetical protein HMPREF0462_0516 [Helicobacter pylori 83]|uniref:Outer membrane protein n=1 Tax=Helicobacter pylori 83 TaxID=585538 RepID=F4D546_HELPX|nr:hypothetical protein HMPREF0462_0516 [Helicobacter pylori 83]